MWVIFFGFIVIGWIILKNEKTFNRSIQILEDRINLQEAKIQELEFEIDDLKRR